ncbi:MAG: GNAT family N-acetyltransferase [Candidatus Promineifilaceae bacterium]
MEAALESFVLRGESDIQLMRDLIEHLPGDSTVVDFEESMLLSSVRATTRLWQDNEKIVGFAFVDDYNNLRFEIEAESRTIQLEDEIMKWGTSCVKKRNIESASNHTLDAAFSTDKVWQIAMLERGGFVRSSRRTLRYARSLSEPLIPYAFPSGFSLGAAGDYDVERLVALHRAAFGTENMTVAQRLAVMQAPGYEEDLDIVAVSPEGDLVAFCICGFEDEDDTKRVGFTDPIGTHPAYQRRGLGKAIVMAGLKRLRNRGVSIVELGTSSTNLPMQRLAESMDFSCVSEKLWFSKEVLSAPNTNVFRSSRQ